MINDFPAVRASQGQMTTAHWLQVCALSDCVQSQAQRAMYLCEIMLLLEELARTCLIEPHGLMILNFCTDVIYRILCSTLESVPDNVSI